MTRCTYLPSCELGTHAHADDRIVLTLEGEFRSKYAARTFELGRLRAIYPRAEIEHRDFYERETVCIGIRLPQNDSGGSQTHELIDEDLAGAAARLSAELDACDSASTLMIESLAAEVEGRLRGRGLGDGSRPRWIRVVLDWLEEEYATPPTLQAIGAEVGRDESYIATTFKRTYGKPIGQYVRDLRLWRTRGLVEDASLPLAEVAQRGGFSDQSHFGRLFKERFSMTPRQYRERAQSFCRPTCL